MMKLGTYRQCVGGLVATLALFSGLFLSMASAETIVDVSDWDANYDLWQSQDGVVTIDDEAIGQGNATTWMEVTFPASASPDDVTDTVYMDAQAFMPGAWSPDWMVAFNFWADDELPVAIQVRWQDLDGAGDIWRYTFTVSESDAWLNFSTAALGDYEAWNNFPFASDENQYLADLASVDWIGIYIYRGTSNEEVYGIDNFRLAIPEPAEMALLGSALISAAAALRRRRRQGAGKAQSAG